MVAYNLPNPFMPAPTAPTPQSRRMVERMLEAIEGPNPKPRRKKPVTRRLSTKR